VIDGETGILVPLAILPPFRGAALPLRDPERTRALGAAGRRRVVEHFSLEKMTREFESLYESLHAGTGVREREGKM
jgi:glycosyltransferase involved in cell wall biosynthesis